MLNSETITTKDISITTDPLSLLRPSYAEYDFRTVPEPQHRKRLAGTTSDPSSLLGPPRPSQAWPEGLGCEIFTAGAKSPWNVERNDIKSPPRGPQKRVAQPFLRTINHVRRKERVRAMVWVLWKGWRGIGAESVEWRRVFDVSRP